MTRDVAYNFFVYIYTHEMRKILSYIYPEVTHIILEILQNHSVIRLKVELSNSNETKQTKSIEFGLELSSLYVPVLNQFLSKEKNEQWN